MNDWEATPLGEVGDVPVSADYYGDSVAERAVWRLRNNTCYIATVGNVPFGEKGDVLVPADYDGDGKADMASGAPRTANGWSTARGPRWLRLENGATCPYRATTAARAGCRRPCLIRRKSDDLGMEHVFPWKRL